MLRLLVLLLILLNAVYYAWSHDLLRAYGFAPVLQTESYRLAQQIRPELVHILPAGEARGVELATQTAARPADCLQASTMLAGTARCLISGRSRPSSRPNANSA